MRWYNKIAQNRKTGFKVVAFDQGRAYSLQNKSITYSLVIGSITGETFLGTTEQFCLDYYSGIIDEDELLLTYSYDIADVVSGSPDSPNSEIRVKKARLEAYKEIPKT